MIFALNPFPTAEASAANNIFHSYVYMLSELSAADLLYLVKGKVSLCFLPNMVSLVLHVLITTKEIIVTAKHINKQVIY